MPKNAKNLCKMPKVSAKNFANYLRTVKGPKYGIWGMSKGKDPKNFIKEFKGIFNIIFIDL